MLSPGKRAAHPAGFALVSVTRSQGVEIPWKKMHRRNPLPVEHNKIATAQVGI